MILSWYIAKHSFGTWPKTHLSIEMKNRAHTQSHTHMIRDPLRFNVMTHLLRESAVCHPSDPYHSNGIMHIYTLLSMLRHLAIVRFWAHARQSWMPTCLAENRTKTPLIYTIYIWLMAWWDNSSVCLFVFHPWFTFMQSKLTFLMSSY